MYLVIAIFYTMQTNNKVNAFFFILCHKKNISVNYQNFKHNRKLCRVISLWEICSHQVLFCSYSIIKDAWF